MTFPQRTVQLLRRQGEALERNSAQEHLTADAQSYTVAWTATTTNPAIGDGALTGRYVRTGAMVHVWLAMVAGSTTTFGSGVWEFSLPVNASSAMRFWPGVAQLLDNGVGDYRGVARIDQATQRLRLIGKDGGGAVVTSTVPFTWGNTDRLSVYVAYLAG